MLLGLAIMNFDHGKGGAGVLRRDRSSFCVVVWCAAFLEYESCCERRAMSCRSFFARDATTESKLLCTDMFDRVALCGSAHIV